MKKLLFILGICLATENVFCQTNGDFQKGADGMEYKIISKGGTEALKMGEYLCLHFTNVLSNKAGDSILNNTRELGMPQYMPLDSNQIPPAYMIIFKQMKIGDSVCTRTLADSMFKKSPDQMPPFMKLGDFIYTNISIENVYKTQAESDAAKGKSMEQAEATAKKKSIAQMAIDNALISEYLKQSNKAAIKTPTGVYVSTIKAGVGPKLTNKQFVKIKYTGKTLNGNIFDTNMDESKGHTDPLTVNLTNDQSLGNGVIPGMTEALLTMQKGTKATMYIPSGLGYGVRGAGADIPANANLIFDVEILSVQSEATFKANQKAKALKAPRPVADKRQMEAPKALDESQEIKAPKQIPEVKNTSKVPIKKKIIKRKK